MKNLAKFFVAVAALFVGVSCTTDTTEDLTQQVVGQGQTVLTVSVGSRTSLGDKVGETYPIYWSEGDVVSLNGVPSEPLTDVEPNATVATFKWNKTFEAPYCLAYPASAKGTVTFAASQSYANGTFAQNAVPMVAYSEESVSELQLEYLAGVLQFNVTGVATLQSVIIETVDGAPLAGTFDYDFAKGTLKAKAGATSSVEYTFGDGLDLTGGNKSFNVAVPAGKYDAVKVIFLDAEGGAMEGTLTADGTNKPAVGVGEVREFTLNYAANTSYHVIKDADSLEQFAEAVVETPALKAVVTADVDASKLTWAPIEGFAGVLRGNGHTISGLKEALFGTLNGTVSNLTLDSTVTVSDNTVCATNSNGKGRIWGAFANKLIGTVEGDVVTPASLIGCVSKGSLTVNTTKYTTCSNTVTTAKDLAFGGLVGMAENAVIKGCSNDKVIESKKFATLPSGTGKWPPVYYGGVVAWIENTTVDGCINNGEFKWNDVTSTSNYIQCLQYGGIVGIAIDRTSAISNCKNYGEMTINQSMRAASIGGFVGYTVADVSYCDNYGKFNENPTAVDGLRYVNGFGGVIGYAPNASTKISYCNNYGDIYLGAKVYYYTLYLGGVIGRAPTSGTSVTYCKNYGDIELEGNKEYANDNYSTVFYVGGVGGHVYGSTAYCENHGDITIAGKGNLRNGTNINSDPCNVVAGVIARKNGSGGAGMKNYGNITVSAEFNATDHNNLGTVDLFIGGLTANTTSAIAGENHGNITVTSKLSNLIECRIAGIACRNSSAITTASKNFGNLTFAGQKYNEEQNGAYAVRAAGCLAYNSAASKNLTNEGVITVGGNITGRIMLGGAVAYSSNTLTTITNTGAVTASGTLGAYLYIGGVGAYLEGDLTSLTNSGSVSYTSTGNGATSIYAGGVAGISGAAITTAENSGPITIAGSFNFLANGGSVFNIGGVVGKASKANSGMKNLKTGTITISSDLVVPATEYYKDGATEKTSNWGGFSIGGVAGMSAHAQTSCSNAANITVSSNFAAVPTTTTGEGESATTKDNYTMHPILIAGALPYLGNENCSTVSNSGKITVSGTHSYKASGLYVGGVSCRAANNAGYIYDKFENSGDIEVSTVFENEGPIVRIAGIMAYSSGVTISNACNEGKIHFTADARVEDALYIGGVIPGDSGNGIYTNSGNKGEIRVDGYSKDLAYIAGFTSVTTGKRTFTDCYNEGHIIYNGTSGVTECARVAGFAADITSAPTVTGFVNKGNITILKQVKYVGGFTCYLNGQDSTAAEIANVTNFVNEGNINYNCVADKNSPIYISGGIARTAWTEGKALHGQTILDWHNKGNITMADGQTKTLFVGGIAGLSVNAIKGCSNTGTVKAQTSGECYVGLINGQPFNAGYPVSYSLVQGTILRNGMEAPVTVDATNFFTYAVGGKGTAANLSTCSATEMPEVPAEEPAEPEVTE